jgi:hypothetical protein
MLWKEVEFAEANVVGQHLEGHRSEPLPGAPDLEERFFAKSAFVQIALERFIPPLALNDVYGAGGMLAL